MIEICCYKNYMYYSLLKTRIDLLIVGVNAKKEQAVILEIWLNDFICKS